ncbi:MAG: 4-hydroxy-tetrahydrodipicolinate reductase [Myxococcaceae bacterium]
MTPKRLVIAGATGRMGETLLRLLPHEKDFQLVGAVAQPAQGGVAGVALVPTLAQALSGGADVVIDFTHADVVQANAQACLDAKVAWVLGTTGLSGSQLERVKQVAQACAVVMAPNFSVGVNVMFRMAAQLAQALGPSYDAEIVETHHRHKRDAPSGTALRIAHEVAGARGQGHDVFRLAREGQVGERRTGEIGIQSLRGGDVAGEHTLFFYGDGERLELTHRATGRDGFAQGAYRAAKFALAKPPGLYDMADVLGLR